MKLLLTLTAVIEAATGLALMSVPAMVARLLLGGELTGVAISLGRVAGFALLSLGLACWPAREAVACAKSPALRAMLVHNLLTALLLISLGFGGEWSGPLLWPAAVLHAMLTGWCVLVLASARRETPARPLPGGMRNSP